MYTIVAGAAALHLFSIRICGHVFNLKVEFLNYFAIVNLKSKEQLVPVFYAT